MMQPRPFIFGLSALPQPPPYRPSGTMQASAPREAMHLPDARLAGPQASGRWERAQRRYGGKSLRSHRGGRPAA